MLQDAIWADEARLADPEYCGQAIAFVEGVDPGLGVLPRQRRGVPRHRRRQGLDARRHATSCGR